MNIKSQCEKKRIINSNNLNKYSLCFLYAKCNFLVFPFLFWGEISTKTQILIWIEEFSALSFQELRVIHSRRGPRSDFQ